MTTLGCLQKILLILMISGNTGDKAVCVRKVKEVTVFTKLDVS